jgi:dephospho-CoA kinase
MKTRISVIGAVGKNGSGKDEVLRHLKAGYGIPFLSSGDIVREIAAKEGIEPTRENLGKISDSYFQMYGKGCFIRIAADKIKASGWKTAGISGVRGPEDVRILKEAFGDDFKLVRVFVTDPKVRYERMVKRAEERDPHSYEQFLKQDENEEQRFSVSTVEAMADYEIANDGTPEEMRRHIDELIKKRDLLGS